MGVTEAEINRMDWSRGYSPLVLEADRPLIEDALRRLRTPGQSTELDYRLQTGGGQVIYLHCTNHLISSGPEGDIIQRLTYDISRRVELETALKNMGFVDTLTGLFNRNRFNTDVAGIQQRRAGRLGVACFDLNGLKDWNDRMGHMAGDALIRRAAACIGAAFPERAYRIGGDEFAVVWEDVAEAEFRRAVDEARARLRAAGVSMAAGACWQADRCDVWRQYDEADRLMYAEKQVYYQESGKTRRRNR